MNANDKIEEEASKKFSFFDFIAAAYEWCTIVFASLIVGVIGWFIVNDLNPGSSGKTIGIIIIIISLIVGIYLATKSAKSNEKDIIPYSIEKDYDNERMI